MTKENGLQKTMEKKRSRIHWNDETEDEKKSDKGTYKEKIKKSFVYGCISSIWIYS